MTVPVGVEAHVTIEDGNRGPTDARKLSGGSGPQFWERRLVIHGLQLLILAVFLLAWQFLPRVHWLSHHFRFLDSFFISSPSATFSKVVDIAVGRGGPSVWKYLERTLEGTLLGVLIGVILGAAFGLLLSNSRFLSRVLRPFITALNAVPRIALIPVVVILFGVSSNTSVAVSVMVVFFVIFFSAYEGGTTVPSQLIDNARVLGASRRMIMAQVRLPYVLAWTMSALPIAIAFSLLTVVATEILTGYPGIGTLLTSATTSDDASLTFAVVVYLAVIGALIVAAADLVKRRLLHWWGG